MTIKVRIAAGAAAYLSTSLGIGYIQHDVVGGNFLKYAAFDAAVIAVLVGVVLLLFTALDGEWWK